MISSINLNQMQDINNKMSIMTTWTISNSNNLVLSIMNLHLKENYKNYGKN